MAYIYRKVNSLITPQNPEADKPGGESILPDASGMSSSPSKNPYASKARNPQAILEANKSENMGNLDTGLQKSIGEQTQGMQKATQEYRGGLQDIGNQYSYNAGDIGNVNQDASYGKLAKILTPQVQKLQLGNVQSSTGAYNPNTQAVAAASNPSGLSELLRNQYGTTKGGSRLDALLYRGTGQAGESIRQNLSDINQFRNAQQANLTQEGQVLEAAKTNADTRAQQLSQDLGQTNAVFRTTAEQAREAAQKDYDLRYAQEKAALDRILASESGYNDQDLAGLKNSISTELVNQGITGLEAEKLIPEYIKDRMVNVDVNQFIDPKKTFQLGEFIDPRYNRIASLLGQSQETLLTPQELAISRNDKGLRDAIANAKQVHMTQAMQAVNAPSDGMENIRDVLKRYAMNPYATIPDQVRVSLGLPTRAQELATQGGGSVFNQISSMF